MAEFDQDAQHQATPTRLLQAQRDGNVARSQELANTIQLACGLGVLYLSIQSVGNQLAQFTTRHWSNSSIASSSVEDFHEQIGGAAFTVTVVLLPLLLAICLISITSHLIQNPSTPLTGRNPINAGGLNPMRGIQKLFSYENLFRSILGLPKIAIIAIVFFATIWNLKTELANLPFQSTGEMLRQLNGFVFTVLAACTATLVVTAAADYVLERFNNARRLRMSDQELRDENRLQQVDPQVSSRRQQIYQELLQAADSE